MGAEDDFAQETRLRPRDRGLWRIENEEEALELGRWKVRYWEVGRCLKHFEMEGPGIERAEGRAEDGELT